MLKIKISFNPRNLLFFFFSCEFVVISPVVILFHYHYFQATRSETLDFLTHALLHNADHGKIQCDQRLLSGEGFMLNLAVLFQRLSSPINVESVSTQPGISYTARLNSSKRANIGRLKRRCCNIFCAEGDGSWTVVRSDQWMVGVKSVKALPSGLTRTGVLKVLG